MCYSLWEYLHIYNICSDKNAAGVVPVMQRIPPKQQKLGVVQIM